MQDSAAKAAQAADGEGNEDADFVLDEWDSDGGRAGTKRGAAAVRCVVAAPQWGMRCHFVMLKWPLVLMSL